jgi:ribosomal-protein-alanine N-acetyltransferase
MEFQIYFRGLRTSDAAAINQLRLNEQYETMIGGSRRFVPLERDQRWLEDLILKDDPTRMYMAVCEKGTDEFIGYASIHEIDYIHGKCCWSGLKIIPEATGKGHGTETALLILQYVFEELRMARCWGVCLVDNHVAKKMFDRAGYQTEGIMRNYNYKNGAMKDAYLLSVTAQDYKKIKKEYRL